jgi:hypothetical protein
MLTASLSWFALERPLLRRRDAPARPARPATTRF